VWICGFFFLGARVDFGTAEEEEEEAWLFEELGAG
jgi:hypothetical protein